MKIFFTGSIPKEIKNAISSLGIFYQTKIKNNMAEMTH